MTKYRFVDGKLINAPDPDEFVRIMRDTSWCPGTSVKNFMVLCSERAKKIGLNIRADSSRNFLHDLIAVGIVAIETESLWN